MSDIHGNLEAFRAVLGDIDTLGIERIVNLGDIVGYGPDPQSCADLVRERGIATVMGNHEQGLINQMYLSRFNPVARDMLLKTRALLDDETVQWLITRPKSLSLDNMRFVHGAPPDLVGEYLWKYSERYGDLMHAFPEHVCFVGHTHELRHIVLDRDTSSCHKLCAGTVTLTADAKHIVNAGAVGQPRGNGPDAKYVLYDPASGELEIRFLPYDTQTTAEKIRRAGFHPGLADRILRGC